MSEQKWNTMWVAIFFIVVAVIFGFCIVKQIDFNKTCIENGYVKKPTTHSHWTKEK
jgi:hypothetical protein